MSAAGIKIATTTPNALAAAAFHEVSGSKKSNKTTAETDHANNGEENSFCILPSLKELQLSSSNNELQQEVPFEKSEQVGDVPENEEENLQTPAFNRDLNEFSKINFKQDAEDQSATQLSPGLCLLQQTAASSSPPPHSYRHSRAYRHFKNPPQPHMCIRATIESGEELFINVLSWTRIVIPQEPSDPIPLYGGMRVPPGSPRSPPIVFAVMANPEVLKDSGRHSKDPEERRAMIELMCDFVEAMNPGIKLVRNAVILKDRDISGELKDVWNAVQAQRDREREEQMILQRQQHQQHFHNITNASTNGGSFISSVNTTNNSDSVTVTTQQMFSKSSNSATAGDAILTTVDIGTPPRNRKITNGVQNDINTSNIDVEKDIETARTNNGQVSLALLTDNFDNNMSIVASEQNTEYKINQHSNQYTLTNNAFSDTINSKDFMEIDSSCKTDANTTNSNNKDLKKQQPTLTNGSSVNNCNETEALSNVSKNISATSTPNTVTSIPAHNPPTTVAPLPTVQQAPSKKEKLGGFLPNGCIFPRFTKNNKHKDKDKDKEPKVKDKEKNVLLSALKKSKDKKSNVNAAATVAVTAANQDEKITSSNSNTTANATSCNQSNDKQQKNCLQQLECGVQKLDLSSTNHHNHTHLAENNINNTSASTIANDISATSKNTANATTNTSGVSVH